MDKPMDDLWSKSKAFIENALKKSGVPGCSVGILQDGEIRAAGFGVANVETQQPVKAGTLFQIGSITKTFTAILAMKLVEEGKLDLHQPVRSYLPDFKVADESVATAVTPYHLLTHSAGWDGDLFLETGDGEDAIQMYIQRMAGREQVAPLGQYYSYNNAGFAVMGGILEAITHQPIEELYRTNILGPVGMKHTCLNAGEAITHDFAVGHHPTPQGPTVARPWRLPRCVLPMGGIITSVGDLLIYAQCYLAKGKTADGKAWLKPETMAEMLTPKMSLSREDHTAVGYSWFLRDVEGGRLVSHGGGTNGQITQLTLLPERDFALAIFTNSNLGAKLIQEIQKFLLKTYLDVAYDDPKEIESTPEQLAAYAGVARRPGVNLYLEWMGNSLVCLEEETIRFPTEKDPPPPQGQPFRIGRCEEDRLIVLDGDGRGGPIDVFRGAEGKIAYLRAGRLFRFSPHVR